MTCWFNTNAPESKLYSSAATQSGLFFKLFTVILISMWCFLPSGFSLAQGSTAGRIITVNGQVDWYSSAADNWQRAVPGSILGQGDRIRTGAGSWAAILLTDETMLQLDQNSLLILKQVSERAGWLNQTRVTPVSGSSPGSNYLLEKGHLWLRNKNINQQIEILTPYVSTSIRGTELDILVSLDHFAVVSVLEGIVKTENAFGSLIVQALEQVTATPGNPLEKQYLISPQETVQWTISLFALVRHLDLSFPDQGDPQGMRSAYESIQKRDLKGAENALDMILQNIPDNPQAWILKSLIALAKGKNEMALEFSETGCSLAPGNPDAWIAKSYAEQAGVDLTAAMVSTDKALTLDPNHVPALVNRAKLYFASGETAKAINASALALKIDQANAEVHSLNGFLMLAKRRTQTAIDSFSTAIRLDPGLGEPYLGLAIAYMRQGRSFEAIEAITTAVLLEPQRSLFLSYWAKMLYEMRRFKQALDILAQAQQLDPNDPTPLLYQSHILRDLNKPFEAIQALHQAISLNDNRAVYRSRFLLDQDLAIKNVSLAELYREMGLSEWGGSKAMASVKYDYNNSAAHDFLADEYRYLVGESSLQARSEDLKAFLLKPANLNTFNTFNDYTAFFEKPDLRATLTGFIGNLGYWDAEAEIKGAVPEADVAFEFQVRRSQRDGINTIDYEDYDNTRARFKWDISDKDTLSVEAGYESFDVGDLGSRSSLDAIPDPLNRSGITSGVVKLGYTRHLSGDSDFLFFVNHRFKNDSYADTHLAGSGTTLLPDVLPGILFDYNYDYFQQQTLEEPYTNLQILQFFRIGDHQLNIGTYQFWSDREYSSTADTDYDFYLNATGDYLFSLTDTELAASNRTRQHQSYYLQDIWKTNRYLTVEAAVYLDKTENVNSEFDTTWSDTSVNPRFGLIYCPTRQDTFRASLIRYLDPIHGIERLDPTDIAGHTLPSFYEGAIIDEVSLGWEHEWQNGYLIGRWFYNEPEYTYEIIQDGIQQEQNISNTYRGTEIGFNYLVGPGIGFSAAYTWFDIVEDQYTPELEGNHQWVWAVITLVHPSGISLAFGPNYFNTRYDDPGMEDEDFWIGAARLEYELPDKRGSIRIEGVNLFDVQFNSVVLSERAGWFSERMVALKVELNF